VETMWGEGIRSIDMSVIQPILPMVSCSFIYGLRKFCFLLIMGHGGYIVGSLSLPFSG
jgi:hypothetical protein